MMCTTNLWLHSLCLVMKMWRVHKGNKLAIKLLLLFFKWNKTKIYRPVSFTWMYCRTTVPLMLSYNCFVAASAFYYGSSCFCWSKNKTLTLKPAVECRLNAWALNAWAKFIMKSWMYYLPVENKNKTGFQTWTKSLDSLCLWSPTCWTVWV